MKELSGDLVKQAMAIGLSASFVASAAGCGVAGARQSAEQHHSANGQELERCFDTVVNPVPQESTPVLPDPPDPRNYPDSASYQAARQTWTHTFDAYQYSHVTQSATGTAQSTLSFPLQKWGRVSGDPVKIAPAHDEVAKQAVVKIQNSKWSGTGFLTSDNAGNSYVVTAAHVVDKGAIGDFTVTDYSGKTSKITKGCYIYEDKGGFVDTGDKDLVAERDVAVVKLASKIGGSQLSLTGVMPPKGDWVFFSNYQDNSEPPNIMEYTGLVAQRPPSNYYVVLDGLVSYDSQNQADAIKQMDKVTGGASGGPVMNKNGEVTGLVSASTKKNNYLELDEVKDMFDIDFPGAVAGESTGFEPVATYVIPSYFALQAMKSPKLAG